MKAMMPMRVMVIALCSVGVRGQDFKVDVGGYHLQFHVIAGKSPAVVFESGGGDDSSAWREILPQIATRTGARLITYDRAGFGQSDLNPAPYSITGEVEGLERGLRQLQVNDDLILVAHSYGGFLAALFAARNPSRVKGLVLIDANLAPFFTDALLSRLTALQRGVLERYKQENPDSGTALQGLLDGFSATVSTLRKVALPTLRITDIISEKPYIPPPNEELGPGSAGWTRAHQEFDKAAPNRRGVVAKGSGHLIMRDRPDLVVDEIAAMFQAAQ